MQPKILAALTVPSLRTTSTKTGRWDSNLQIQPILAVLIVPFLNITGEVGLALPEAVILAALIVHSLLLQETHFYRRVF